MAGKIVAGTLEADTWQNSDGTENYKCRAWVNFTGQGTPTIQASGNVSSLTDNGTNDFTVNFSTAMPDKYYTLSGAAQYNLDNLVVAVLSYRGHPTAYNFISTSSCRIVGKFNIASGNPDTDPLVVSAAFHR